MSAPRPAAQGSTNPPLGNEAFARQHFGRAQEGTMAASTAPRFKSREAALRFYFRASELLTPNGKPGIFSTRRPRHIHRGPNLIDDLLALDSCFHGLNDVQLWLLHELYGSGGFHMT